jgi:hypothetical protein
MTQKPVLRVITHLVVDIGSDIVDIGSDRKIFGDRHCHLCQHPQTLENFRRVAPLLRARKKNDSNGRELLKFDMLPEDFLRIFIEKYCLY